MQCVWVLQVMLFSKWRKNSNLQKKGNNEKTKEKPTFITTKITTRPTFKAASETDERVK